MPQTPASDCWFLTGPTAAGKTARGRGACAAHRRGNHLHGFDGALPGHGHRHRQTHAAKSAAAPHHLIDVLRPQQQFSLAQYLDAAFQAVAEIRDSGPGSAVRRRDAALLEGAVAGDFPGPGRRLGIAATAGGGGPAERPRLALSPAGRRGPGRRASAAPQRHAAAHPRHRGL